MTDRKEQANRLREFRLDLKEQDIQRDILTWLKARGVVCWKCDLGGVRVAGGKRAKNPMKGFPDIALVIPPTGRLATIEVKRDDGRMSPEQLRWMEILMGKGVTYILARHLNDVVNVIGPYLEQGA